MISQRDSEGSHRGILRRISHRDSQKESQRDSERDLLIVIGISKISRRDSQMDFTDGSNRGICGGTSPRKFGADFLRGNLSEGFSDQRDLTEGF